MTVNQGRNLLVRDDVRGVEMRAEVKRRERSERHHKGLVV